MKAKSASIRRLEGGGGYLYRQLADRFRDDIASGVFAPGSRLPSLDQIASDHCVNRLTARKAIGALVDEGLIVRRHGSGNYIAPMLEQPLTRLTSFTEELKQRGFEPHSRWIRRVVGPAMPEEMVALGLSPGTRVARLERVRLVVPEGKGRQAEVLGRGPEAAPAVVALLEQLGVM